MIDENLRNKNMETKRINTILLSIMSIMLTLIAWGGNNYYQDQKDFNKEWIKNITNVSKNQIIIDYRLGNLEDEHGIHSPPLQIAL